MAFTEAQVKSLEAKLDSKACQDSPRQDTTLAYVEGWHVIAEANRIFGYDAWDRHTLIHALRLVWFCKPPLCGCRLYRQGPHRSQGWRHSHHPRRLWQREAKAPTPGEAHELALKAAETDATKRALATFGNPFGLALYDRELAG